MLNNLHIVTVMVAPLYVNMLTLVCRETGLNCDYIIKGETEEDILKNGAEHATQAHGMNAGDIYVNRIPANLEKTNAATKTIAKNIGIIYSRVSVVPP